MTACEVEVSLLFKVIYFFYGVGSRGRALPRVGSPEIAGPMGGAQSGLHRFTSVIAGVRSGGNPWGRLKIGQCAAPIR